MSRSPLLSGLVLVAATTIVVWTVARELARGWFLPAVQGQLVSELEGSLADQRELARLAPDTAALRRRRFDETQKLLKHLRILTLSGDDLRQRHAALLLAGALAVVAAAAGIHTVRQTRRDRREAAHKERDRQRLASLEDLARWQEAARRHAHEMRTPLAAALLDLERVHAAVGALPDGTQRATLGSLASQLQGDVQRLREFAQAFAAFGRLPDPRLVACDLGAFVGEFAQRFAGAWPELALTATAPPGRFPVRIDADLMRQVLVNLADNSAGALREAGVAHGALRLRAVPAETGFSVLASDDGPGIAAAARRHLFQPYATFRAGGTGLGLAIARKILLDHGGDLELAESGTAGTTFRLWLPSAAGEAAA